MAMRLDAPTRSEGGLRRGTCMLVSEARVETDYSLEPTL